MQEVYRIIHTDESLKDLGHMADPERTAVVPSGLTFDELLDAISSSAAHGFVYSHCDLRNKKFYFRRDN